MKLTIEKFYTLFLEKYIVDDLTNIKDPIGMHGNRLENRSCNNRSFLPHLKTLQKSFW
jgi:hypothetical protein